MKFSLSDQSTGYTIQAYGDDGVVVAGMRFDTSLVVTQDRIIPQWRPQGVHQLEAADFEPLCQLQPELVLLGTGRQQHFPPASLYAPLIEANIGIEIMTTPAACRTYNILMAEDRRVVAALLLD